MHQKSICFYIQWGIALFDLPSSAMEDRLGDILQGVCSPKKKEEEKPETELQLHATLFYIRHSSTKYINMFFFSLINTPLYVKMVCRR